MVCANKDTIHTQYLDNKMEEKITYKFIKQNYRTSINYKGESAD